MEADYNNVAELDQYDDVGIDNENQEELSVNERIEVDRRLAQEDRMRANMQGRRPGAFLDDEFENDEE